MMGQDNITWTGARAPGVERRRSLAWRCSTEQVASGSERRLHAARESTKDGGKLDLATGMLGASLTVSTIMEGPVRWASFGAVPRENPPYGILGGTMETAASFEVRNAPSSYPTSAFIARSGFSCVGGADASEHSEPGCRWSCPRVPINPGARTSCRTR